MTLTQAEERLAELEARIERTPSRFDRSHGVRSEQPDRTRYITRDTDRELHDLYAEARAWWRVIEGLRKEAA